MISYGKLGTKGSGGYLSKRGPSVGIIPSGYIGKIYTSGKKLYRKGIGSGYVNYVTAPVVLKYSPSYGSGHITGKTLGGYSAGLSSGVYGHFPQIGFGKSISPFAYSRYPYTGYGGLSKSYGPIGFGGKIHSPVLYKGISKVYNPVYRPYRGKGAIYSSGYSGKGSLYGRSIGFGKYGGGFIPGKSYRYPFLVGFSGYGKKY